METVHNPKNIQARDLLIDDQYIKNRQQFYPKPDQPYYKKPYKFTKPHKPFQSKPKTKFDPKNITYYKCNQKGHTSRFCKVNTKLHELQIDEDTINQIQNLYIEATYTDHSPSDTSEEEYIYIYLQGRIKVIRNIYFSYNFYHAS